MGKGMNFLERGRLELVYGLVLFAVVLELILSCFPEVFRVTFHPIFKEGASEGVLPFTAQAGQLKAQGFGLTPAPL